MPLPRTPTNLLVQSGNGQVYLSWDASVGSSGYTILRSTDGGLNYSTLTSTTGLSYYDTTASTGQLLFYEIQAFNGTGNSGSTDPASITCVTFGQQSLGGIRLLAQQRADMVNSDFVTKSEWNSYINHSYTELYDLLVAVYADDFYVATPYQFQTDGRVPALYPLPSNFYHLLGVDLTINASNQSYLTMRKFNFTQRNRYIFGNTPVSFLGFLNIKYRVLGSNIMFIPQPSSNQQIQLWYIPRPTTLLADNDILDGIAGWDEYVIVDAAIKAMQKEESDVTVLMAQKQALKLRIEAMAANRDAGMPEQASDLRGLSGYANVWGSDSPFGGY